MVSTCAFSPSRCHGPIQLSNHNRTATKRRSDIWPSFCSVCSVEAYGKGTMDIGIRLDSMPGHYILVCMCNSPNPPLDGYQFDKTVFGWHGFHAESGKVWRGTNLGQPWQTGDIIRLSLDCDRHTLTGRHERTGTTQTLADVTGDLYLYISLYHADHQVTIL